MEEPRGKESEGRMATAKKTQKTAAGKKRSSKKNQNSVAQEITGYGLIVLGVFCLAAVLMGGVGLLGRSLASAVFGLFGLGAYVVPLLLVAGDHARNDMAGSGPDSWRSRLEAEGYTVRVTLRGLGLLPAVRELYRTHLARALEEDGHGL